MLRSADGADSSPEGIMAISQRMIPGEGTCVRKTARPAGALVVHQPSASIWSAGLSPLNRSRRSPVEVLVVGRRNHIARDRGWLRFVVLAIRQPQVSRHTRDQRQLRLAVPARLSMVAIQGRIGPESSAHQRESFCVKPLAGASSVVVPA